MIFSGPLNTGVAAGGAGVATANATSSHPLHGFIAGVYIRYNDSPPAGTTDVTIATAGNGSPAYTLLTLTNAATDGLFMVRDNPVDTAGASLATTWENIPIADNVKVTIAQANNSDSVDIWLLLIE